MYQRPLGCTHCEALPSESDIRRQMQTSGEPSIVWEMDVPLHPTTPQATIRLCALFAQPRLVQWTWWDRHIARPVLCLVVWCYNTLVGNRRARYRLTHDG